MKKILIAAAVMSAMSTSALAELRINGFANLVAGKANTEDATMGYSDNINFSQQSNFALQVSADINDKVSATAQLIARGENDYDVDMEWAYLTYEVSNELSVSAGRLRMPLFMYSASLDVGYSYHWITPPDAVYSVPFDRIDGTQITYSDYNQFFDYSVQLAVGNSENEFVSYGQQSYIKNDDIVTLVGKLNKDNLTLRGVFARGTGTLEIEGVTTAIQGINQISPELASLLEAKDDRGEFYGLGFSYDNAEWFVMGEYTVVEIEDSFYPKETNSYISAGFRSGKYTPFVSIESHDMNDGIKFLDSASSFPSQVQQTAEAALVAVQSPFVDDAISTTVGLRYDVSTGIALKLDATRYNDRLSDMQDTTLFRGAVSYVF